MQGLRFLPYLQTNKLACHNFMGTGIKHKTPGLETKDSLLLTATAVDRVAAILDGSPSPNSHGVMQRRPVNSCTYSALCYREGLRA